MEGTSAERAARGTAAGYQRNPTDTAEWILYGSRLMKWSGILMCGVCAVCLLSVASAPAGAFDWKMPWQRHSNNLEGAPGTWDLIGYLKCACGRCKWKLDRPNSCYCTCPPYLKPHYGYSPTRWRQLDVPWCVAPRDVIHTPGPMTPWSLPAAGEERLPLPALERSADSPPDNGEIPLPPAPPWDLEDPFPGNGK